MPILASVLGRTIQDSRGQPTVEVTLTDDRGMLATASLPMGSSLGKYETPGVTADEAANIINTVLAPALLRTSVATQAELDTILQSFYTQGEPGRIGINSTLGISLAGARLFA